MLFLLAFQIYRALKPVRLAAGCHYMGFISRACQQSACHKRSARRVETVRIGHEAVGCSMQPSRATYGQALNAGQVFISREDAKELEKVSGGRSQYQSVK